jgi:hypothetical protein
MDFRSFVLALRRRDALAVREWVQDARREGLVLSELPPPVGLDEVEQALAASAVELLARQWSQEPPSWSKDVGPSPVPVFLVAAAERMPRLRRLCELEGPEQLRKRGFYAPPEFLAFA